MRFCLCLVALLAVTLGFAAAQMFGNRDGPNGPALTMVATKDLAVLTADVAKMQLNIKAIVKDRNTLAGAINAQADELLLLRARVDTLLTEEAIP